MYYLEIEEIEIVHVSLYFIFLKYQNYHINMYLMKIYLSFQPNQTSFYLFYIYPFLL
jgi:hypothetical protein